MTPALVQRRIEGTDRDRTEGHGLPPGFRRFLMPLLSTFEPHRAILLAARARSLAAAHAGTMPGYLTHSQARTGRWRIELPEWALDQRNQITGPADNPKLLVAMCNTKDPGCMPDGEDSITADWDHVRAAQENTVAAIKGTLTWTDPATGRVQVIRPGPQVIYYRPRGLKLTESPVLAGPPISASIFDLAMVFYQTAAERRAAVADIEAQRKLCFYIPKVESAEEAGWWSNLIAAMEDAIDIPVGITRVMFLIESLPAAYQVEEILHATRWHVIGLNLGRWDYMASLLHFKLADPGWILPDRNTIPHDIPFFQNIRARIVDVCHRRGALAIGGMTALFPDRKDPALNQRALDRLAIDKRNEADMGFDGAWTGHPDQHDVAIVQFPAPNQIHRTHPEAPEHPDLTPAPPMPPTPPAQNHISVAGTRDAVRTVIEYRFGVLAGLGARLIKGVDQQGNVIGGFMEDLATDRIYRLMIAQRARHSVTTQEGTRITQGLVTLMFDEELEKILKEHREEPEFMAIEAGYRRARTLSEEMIHRGDF